jgi:hypothetical protein
LIGFSSHFDLIQPENALIEAFRRIQVPDIANSSVGKSARASILFLPHLTSWWSQASATMRACFDSMLGELIAIRTSRAFQDEHSAPLIGTLLLRASFFRVNMLMILLFSFSSELCVVAVDFVGSALSRSARAFVLILSTTCRWLLDSKLCFKLYIKLSSYNC